ncbi:hypothetical protein C8R44DRAFT_890707 [Mycena epipterygia]|nr:hypothetical protein C8R44DRAFT_890707 [Mycena epipterygia]
MPNPCTRCPRRLATRCRMLLPCILSGAYCIPPVTACRVSPAGAFAALRRALPHSCATPLGVLPPYLLFGAYLSPRLIAVRVPAAPGGAGGAFAASRPRHAPSCARAHLLFGA